jgi:hypothetical protein
MERMTSRARPRKMMNQSRIRGLATAVLLCAGLAGCGTAVATSPLATIPPTGGQGGAPVATTAAPEVGCASVSQATTVSVQRHALVAEPLPVGARTVTQHNAALVRALFGDLCAAVTHADNPPPPMLCPADFGISYTGTFYDGQRLLALFLYSISGCPRVTVTAAGTMHGTMLIGTAAAAAPHLKADLAAVLGLPESQVFGASTQTQINQVKPST